MDFLDNLMTLLPATRKAEMEAMLTDMSPEDRAELAATTEAEYNRQRAKKSMRNISHALRAHHADRRPEGAAATRRRKQMERVCIDRLNANGAD